MHFFPSHGGNLAWASATYGLPPQDFVDFSANINPLGPSPAVLEAIKANLWRVAHYPDPECRELKDALAGHLGVEERCIVVGNGASELIYLLVRVLPRGRAVIPVPTFSEYARAVEAAGGEVKYVFMDPGSGFSLPLEEVKAELVRGAGSLFLCNPNNPTGNLYARRELEELLDLAAELGVYVVVDEAFMDFVLEPGGHTLLPLAGRHPRLILLYSLTKILAIPGLRLGALLGPPEITAELSRVKIPWSVNALAQVAGVAGLQDREYLALTRRAVAREREFLFRELGRVPGLRPFRSEANFLLVEARLDRLSTLELIYRLGQKGILLRHCANFVGLSADYFRLAVRGRGENQRLLAALQEVLDRS